MGEISYKKGMRCALYGGLIGSLKRHFEVKERKKPMMKNHAEFCYWLMKQIDKDLYRTCVSDGQEIYVTNARWGMILPANGLAEGKWIPVKPSRKKEFIWVADTDETTSDVAIKMKDGYIFDLRTRCEFPEISYGASFGSTRKMDKVDRLVNHLQYELIRDATRQGLRVGFNYRYLLIAAKYSVEMDVCIEEFDVNETMSVISYANSTKFCLAGMLF